MYTKNIRFTVIHMNSIQKKYIYRFSFIQITFRNISVNK